MERSGWPPILYVGRKNNVIFQKFHSWMVWMMGQRVTPVSLPQAGKAARFQREMAKKMTKGHFMEHCTQGWLLGRHQWKIITGISKLLRGSGAEVE